MSGDIKPKPPDGFSNRAALATVFLVVMIDLLGFGIVLPLLPFYAQEFAATPLTIGLLYSVYSLMQLIFSPLWGSLSDRMGRRPIMLLSTLGASLAYILFGFAESLALLFFSRVLAGGMGGNISTAQAYIADVTTKENRARGMGLIGAAFGIGFVVGPASATLMIHPGFHSFVGGLGAESLAAWMEANRFALPGFFAAFLSFCSFMMVLFKLPETVGRVRAGQAGRAEHAGQAEQTDMAGEGAGRAEGGHGTRRAGVFTRRFWQRLFQAAEHHQHPHQHQHQHQHQHPHPNHGDPQNQASAISSPRKKHKTIPLLALLLIAFFLLSFGESSLYSAFPLFASERLSLTAEQVGIQFFFIGIIAVVIQGFLIKPLTRRFSEQRLFLVGNGLMVAGLGSIPLAGSMVQLAVALSVMAVGKSLNTPTMTSLISQQADEREVGAVMGTAQGLSGLGRMIGPAWGGAMFALAYALPFVATAAIVSGTLWIGVRILRSGKREVRV